MRNYLLLTIAGCCVLKLQRVSGEGNPCLGTIRVEAVPRGSNPPSVSFPAGSSL